MHNPFSSKKTERLFKEEAKNESNLLDREIVADRDSLRFSPAKVALRWMRSEEPSNIDLLHLKNVGERVMIGFGLGASILVGSAANDGLIVEACKTEVDALEQQVDEDWCINPFDVTKVWASSFLLAAGAGYSGLRKANKLDYGTRKDLDRSTSDG